MTAHETSSSVPDAAVEPGRGGDGVTDALIHDRITLAALDRLSHAFESSAKRTELMVYPFLFAFIILAAYGFYLVFSLARDVHALSVSVETNMSVLASNMQAVARNIDEIGTDINTLSKSVGGMSVGVDSMARDVKTLNPMLTSMANMDQSMRDMTLNTTVMRDDMASLNRNISRPMRVMNSFMPW